MKLHSRLRAALLQGTMLLSPALVLVAPAAASAQSIAANARPQGGQVVGGAAAITQAPSTTTITQSTDRAIIDWRSFSVGRDQSVQFRQPAATSMTLNRVTGPDPSVIAGRVTANGGIALVNQSGVFFAGGAQVSAQSVIVSTADIANGGFMAGGALHFDRPGKPGARIDNAGTITVKQAGLAALVAPQVANSGVIQANLATVVLGGAERHVIDINGDGLVSFDITDAVRTRPAGGEALVTNTGAISARGGTVLLTARAADGIVQNLVRAGGTISAGTDPATGRTGQVLFTGTGGSIRVEGTVDATGTAPGTTGGSIAVSAERVLIAAPARLDASGAAGGGSIAIGITSAGAKAERTGIEAGALLRADATGRGKGGRIDVMAKNAAIQAGTLTARGGPAGGDGGRIEISSGGGLQLAGRIDAGAPAGLAGQVIIDPQFLTIVASGDPRANVLDSDLSDQILAGGDPPTNAFVTAGQIAAITGDLTLQATDTITVAAAVTKPAGGLELDTAGTLTINAPLVLGAGDLVLTAQTMALNDLVQVSSANQVVLNAFGRVGGGSVIEAGAGRITGGVLTQGRLPFADITLNGDNQVARIATLNATNTLAFTNVVNLLVGGTVTGTNSAHVDVRGGDLAIDGTITSSGTPNAAQLRASGNIALGATGTVSATGIAMLAAFDFAGGTVDPRGTGGISLAGAVIGIPFGAAGSPTVNPVLLAAGTGGIAQPSGVVQAGTLMVNSGGNATLTSVQPTFAGSNQIDILGPSDVAGDFSLAAYKLASAGSIGLGGDLLLSGDIIAGGTLTLTAMNSGLLQQPGSRIIAGGLSATAGTFNIVFGGDNAVATIGPVTANNFTFRNLTDLVVAGPVDSTGDVTIAVAGGNLGVTGDITSNGNDITLLASGNVSVGPSASIVGVPSDSSPIIIIRAASPDSGFDPALPGGVTLAGTLAASTLGLFAGTGGITQTNGAIAVRGLAARSGANILLDRTANNVGTVLDVDAAGDFVFDNGANAIDVAGHVTAANATLTTTGTLQLSQGCTSFGASCSVTDATIDVGGGVVVFQSAFLAMTRPANLVTAGLVEIAPRVTSPVLVGGAAGSSVAGSFSVNQDVLTHIDATTLRLGATAPGGTTASSIRLIAPVNFANTLDLRSLGGIAQDAGAALTVGTLTGSAGGAITLTDGNTIGAVGDLSAGGAIDLTVAGAMTLTGLVVAPGQTVSLAAGTGIAETGAGRVSAATLAARSTASDIAMAGANTVDALGNVTAPGDFTFNDTAPLLSVATGATVSAAGVAITSAGALALAGEIDGTTVDLTAATGIAGNGVIAAGTLAARTAAGDISLTGGNAVVGLGDVSAPGSFTLNDGVRLLTVLAGATVSAGTGMSITDAGAITLAGQLSAPGQTIALVADTGIGGTGAITTGTLTAQTAKGNIALTGANLVDMLGNVAAPGSVNFNDTTALLTVAAGATVSAGTGITITETGTLALAGSLSTPGQTVDLTAGSGISGTGIITAALLNARTAAGDTVLTGANVVDAIGAVTTPGAFTFNDTVALLTVAPGTTIVTGTGISLADTGAIAITGNLAAPSQPIALAAGTGISGTGAITAASLTVRTTAGDIALSGANVVAALGAVATPGHFTFNDTAALLTIPAGTTLGAGTGVAISEAGALALAGAISSPGQTVGLTAGTGISGTGAITAALVNASTAAGDIALPGANAVDALGVITAPGNVTFNDTVAQLTIAPGTTVSAGGNIAIGETGSLVLTGQLAAPGQTVALSAGTGISGTGPIIAGTLTARTVAGDISLTGPNAVAGLGDVATPGNFAFNDGVRVLTILAGATVSAGSGMAIANAGVVTVDGQLAAPGQTIALAADTGIGGTGAITAGTLAARTAAGDILLAGPNHIDRLGATSAPGNLSFNDDAASLTVPSGTTVQAGGTARITGAGDITIGGTASAATLSLQAAGILSVNGFSAIARSGPLALSGSVVTITGLVAAATDIIVNAATANLGGTATGRALTINAPAVAFNGLNAAGMQVNLFLGPSGTAAGTLDANGLLVAGGSGATLFGTLAGIGGDAAAVRGVRADAAGTPFVGPPPAPDSFTLNGCPIGVAVCRPLLVAPITVAANPLVIIRDLDPRRFAVELTDSFLLLPRPPSLNLLRQPARDPDEDLDLAPPNVRAEDY